MVNIPKEELHRETCQKVGRCVQTEGEVQMGVKKIFALVEGTQGERLEKRDS